jgi:hypothetical protein
MLVACRLAGLSALGFDYAVGALGGNWRAATLTGRAYGRFRGKCGP